MAPPQDMPHSVSRTLSETLEHLARVDPERVYASVPVSKDISQGFRDVRMREMLHAIDAYAWWLHDNLGHSKSFETLAYVGVSDLRYAVFFYAATKCGYKACFLSPRLPLDQNLSLLRQTDCNYFFYALELEPNALELQKQTTSLTVQVLAPFDDWLTRYTKPYPYNKKFEDSKWDPIVVLHSSGSTGPAKPITLNNGYFSILDLPMPLVPGRDSRFHEIFNFEGSRGGHFYSPSPPFHLSGVLALCVYPVYSKTTATVVLGPSDQPPIGALIKQIMDHMELKLLFALPMLVEQVARTEGGLERLKQLDYLTYTGGPLPKWIGDALANDVQIRIFYGSTEAGGAPLLLPKREDWEYMEFHPCLEITMEPVVDKLFELVFKESTSAALYRGNVWTFPEVRDWWTRDLFEEHPSKPGLWRYYGRRDDITTLSNGEPLNPIPLEAAILQNPHITGVMILGQNRPEPVALLEPSDQALYESPNQLLDDFVWPLIQQTNATVPTHARIRRDKIAIVPAGGLVRAPKGTVVRALTEQKFSDIIEGLYVQDVVGEAAKKGHGIVNGAGIGPEKT